MRPRGYGPAFPCVRVIAILETMSRNHRRFIAYVGVWSSLAVCGSSACGTPPRGAENAEPQLEENVQPDINAAQERLTELVMALSGVVGIGQSRCDDEPCFRVYVSSLTPELERRIPGNFEGIPVEIVESGAFRAREP